MSITGGIIVGAVVIILVAVFGASFHIVDIGYEISNCRKYGLLYNDNTQFVRPGAYSQGRYLIGMDAKII